MKKLLILLFSLLISFNSYGETYACSYTCALSESDICQSGYQRVNDRIFKNVRGSDIYNIVENEKFIAMSENAVKDFYGATVAIVINKSNLNYIQSLTSIMDISSSESKVTHHIGKCIRID